MLDTIKNQNGMSALLTVVIISAASLIMAKSMAFLSLTELEMGDKAVRGDISFFAADACIEEALHQIRLDNDFSAVNQALSGGGIDCRYSTGYSGVDRLIEAAANKDGYEQSIRAVASVEGGRVRIISYEIGEN